MPAVLEPATLYVSERHRLAEHLCACGCGSEVSLPLGPSEWSVESHGESVSLRPSVGNWRLPCRAHYMIVGSRTVWCGTWSEDAIHSRRLQDRAEKQREVTGRHRRHPWWLRLWYGLWRWWHRRRL